MFRRDVEYKDMMDVLQQDFIAEKAFFNPLEKRINISDVRNFIEFEKDSLRKRGRASSHLYHKGIVKDLFKILDKFNIIEK